MNYYYEKYLKGEVDINLNNINFDKLSFEDHFYLLLCKALDSKNKKNFPLSDACANAIMEMYDLSLDVKKYSPDDSFFKDKVIKEDFNIFKLTKKYTIQGSIGIPLFLIIPISLVMLTIFVCLSIYVFWFTKQGVVAGAFIFLIALFVLFFGINQSIVQKRLDIARKTVFSENEKRLINYEKYLGITFYFMYYCDYPSKDLLTFLKDYFLYFIERLSKEYIVDPMKEEYEEFENIDLAYTFIYEFGSNENLERLIYLHSKKEMDNEVFEEIRDIIKRLNDAGEDENKERLISDQALFRPDPFWEKIRKDAKNVLEKLPFERLDEEKVAWFEKIIRE